MRSTFQSEIHTTSESEMHTTDLLSQLNNPDPSFHVMLNKYDRFNKLKIQFCCSLKHRIAILGVIWPQWFIHLPTIGWGCKKSQGD